MFCGYCGAQVPDGLAYCPGCGNAMDQQQSLYSTAQAAVSPTYSQEPTPEAVMEHLGYASELEKTVYTYRCLSQKIQKKIDSLGRSKNIRAVPNKVLWIYGGMLAFGVLMWLKFFISLSQYGIVPKVIMILVAVIMAPSLIKIGHKFVVAKNARELTNAAMAQDEQRVAREKYQIVQLQQQQNDVQSRMNDTKALLQRLYDVNIVHPNYRNLSAVTTILEYYQSGRCTQLGGPSGAYSIYSFESKLSNIDSKLEVIHRDLEAIRHTQKMLHSALVSANDLLDRICEQNDDILRTNRQIAENTELTAYNTSVIRTNTAVSAYLDMANYIRS